MTLQSAEIKFTKHAILRIKQRTKLAPQLIADLIHKDRFVVVSQDIGLYHLVFYSIPDSRCFIIFLDAGSDEEAEKTVVTVVPLNVSRNRRWRISPEVLIKANKLALYPDFKKKPGDDLKIIWPTCKKGLEDNPNSNATVTKVRPTTAIKLEAESLPGLKLACYFRSFLGSDVKVIQLSFAASETQLVNWLQQPSVVSIEDKLQIIDAIRNKVSKEFLDSHGFHSVYYKIGQRGSLNELFLP